MNWIYRLYTLCEDDAIVIYIGVTDNTQRRMKQHARDKHWWPLVDYVETIPAGPDREAAEAKEQRMIENIGPIYNVTHNAPLDLHRPRENFRQVRWSDQLSEWIVYDVRDQREAEQQRLSKQRTEPGNGLVSIQQLARQLVTPTPEEQ